MGEAKLLPCPFCERSELEVDDLGKVVWCTSCKTMGPRPVDWPEVTSGPAAIDRWNRRPDLGEVVNAAWRKATLLGIELAEERVISEARERANVAARERIAELERQVATSIYVETGMAFLGSELMNASASLRFAAWIESTGKRRAQVARDLGCDRSMVSVLCSGRARPGLELAAKIERASGGAIPASAWAPA